MGAPQTSNALWWLCAVVRAAACAVMPACVCCPAAGRAGASQPRQLAAQLAHTAVRALPNLSQDFLEALVPKARCCSRAFFLAWLRAPCAVPLLWAVPACCAVGSGSSLSCESALCTLRTRRRPSPPPLNSTPRPRDRSSATAGRWTSGARSTCHRGCRPRCRRARRWPLTACSSTCRRGILSGTTSVGADCTAALAGCHGGAGDEGGRAVPALC